MAQNQQIHAVPGESQQAHLLLLLLLLPFHPPDLLPLFLDVGLLHIGHGRCLQLLVLALLRLPDLQVALLVGMPVKPPGLDHLDIEEPGIHTPVPFLLPGSDGVALHILVELVNPPHRRIIVLDNLRAGNRDKALTMASKSPAGTNWLWSTEVAGNINRLRVLPHTGTDVVTPSSVHVPSGHSLCSILLVGEGHPHHAVLPEGANHAPASLRHVITKIKVDEEIVRRQLGARAQAVLLSQPEYYIGPLAQALVGNLSPDSSIGLAA